MTFLIIETFAVVQIIRGLFGNITAEAVQKIEQVQSTIAFRNKQLEAAITNNPDKVDVYKRQQQKLFKKLHKSSPLLLLEINN